LLSSTKGGGKMSSNLFFIGRPTKREGKRGGGSNNRVYSSQATSSWVSTEREKTNRMRFCQEDA